MSLAAWVLNATAQRHRNHDLTWNRVAMDNTQKILNNKLTRLSLLGIIILQSDRSVENNRKKAEKHCESNNRHQICMYLDTFEVFAPALPRIIHLNNNKTKKNGESF